MSFACGLTTGELDGYMSVNTDAQVRPAAGRRPVLGRRLLLRWGLTYGAYICAISRFLLHISSSTS